MVAIEIITDGTGNPTPMRFLALFMTSAEQ